jgi:Domain of unknown function DUF29
VSSMVLSSISPEGPLRRYFMSQICCDIEPTSAMAKTSSYRRQFTTVPDSFGADFPPDADWAKFPRMNAAASLEQPADDWRDEIVEWRLQLEKILTRSIEANLDLPARYRAALRLVRRLERDVPGLIRRLPAECPYTLEQIIGSGDEDRFAVPSAPPA